tara:strand:+ start:358 stop:597 length:240 start_codon:yes stop_codon:yes gene_type:complete
MTDEIEMMKETIDELIKALELLKDEFKGLIIEFEYNEKSIESTKKLARAVCELQEEMKKNHGDVFFINEINAPTRMGIE